MAAMKSVGFRLTMGGKAEVVDDFRDVADAGKLAMATIAYSAEDAAEKGARAADDLSERQIRSMAKIAAFAQQGGLSAPTLRADAQPADLSRDLANLKIAAALKGELDPLWAATQRLNTELARLSQIEKLGVLGTEEIAAAQARARAQFDETATAITRGGTAASAAQERLEQRTRAFMAALSPAYAAQSRFNTEMAEARSLISAGTISLDDYCDKLRQEQAALDAVSVAQARGGASTGALRSAMQGLSFQAQDAFTQISMGTNPLSVLAIQGGQAAGQMAYLEGAAGSAARFFLGPWGLAITGGLLLLGALWDHEKKAGEEAEKLKQKAQGAGIGVDGLGAATLDATAAIDLLNKAQLNDRTGEIAANARSAAAARIDQANATVAAAKAQGTLALAEAKASLAKAEKRRDEDAGDDMRSPLAKMLGVARGSTRADAANRRAYDTDVAMAQGRVAKIEGQFARLDASYANFRKRVVSQAIAGDGEMRESHLKLITATDATTAAQARRDQTVRQARIEFDAGTRSETSYAAAVREADVQLKKVTDSAGRAGGAHHVEATSARTAGAAARDQARDLASLEDQFDPTAAAARKYREELAKIAAAKLDPATAARYAASAHDAFVKARAAGFSLPSVEDARPEADAWDRQQNEQEQAAQRRAEHVQRMLADQRDSLTIGQRELELVGTSDHYRDAELDKLRLKLSLQHDGIDAASAEGQQLVDNAERLAEVNAQLRLAGAASDELRSTGDRFLEDLLNPDGSGLKTLLHDIENEFIKLAALNPLKNFLLGENNPTLGGVIGTLGGLLGGGSGGFSLDVAGLERASGAGLLGLPHNATGTEDWSGGTTWVGENGPELLDLPGGSRITPAAASRAIAAGNDNPPFALHIDASVNAPGADPAALARVEAGQQRMQRDLPGIVVAAFHEARARGQIR